MTDLAAPESSAAQTSLWASAIIRTLVAKGVERFVVAPGSRSTPLVAAANESGISTVVIGDERSAAFFALGCGRAGSLCAMITTSGSAITHAFPAVVEARAEGIPILLLSADRPPELHGIGANQTIPQENIFGAHVVTSVSFPAPDSRIPATLAARMSEDAIDAALREPGPVHLNVPFRKPLEPAPFSWPQELHGLANLPPTSRSRSFTSETLVSTEAVDFLRAELRSGSSVLVAVGAIGSPSERIAARSLVQHLNLSGAKVFADARSGLRDLDSGLRAYLRDPLLMSKVAPDRTLFLGGGFIEERIYALASSCRSSRTYRVAGNAALTPRQARIDPREIGIHTIEGSLASLAESLDDLRLDTRGAWTLRPPTSEWLGDVFSEMQLAASLSDVPGILYAGSSMPIRDVDRFASHPRVLAQRGASGIDGMIASACGVAASSDSQVTLVVGDQTFLHDQGSLHYVRRHRNLRIIVVDNRGGRIFEMLPIATPERKSLVQKYFLDADGPDIKKLGEAHSLEVRVAEDLAAFRTALSSSAQLIIARTAPGAAAERAAIREREHHWLRTQLGLSTSSST